MRSLSFLLTLFVIIASESFLRAQTPLPNPTPINPAITVTPSGDYGTGTPSLLACPGFSGCGDPARGGIYAGASFYYLKPFFNNNIAYQTTTQANTPSAQITNTQFNWNMQPALATWIGYTFDGGLGVRARYFHFDGDSTSNTLTNTGSATIPTLIFGSPNLPYTSGNSFGSPGLVLASGFGADHITFQSGLRVDTIDLDMTYDWDLAGWKLLGFGGVRYLSIQQTYRETLTNNGAGSPITDTEAQQLNYVRNFTGLGPTVGLQANCPIARTGLSLFASARGSLVVGSCQQTTNLHQVINNPGGLLGSQNNNPQTVTNGSQVIPVADLELGLEYAFSFSRSELFVRAAAVNNTYFDAGNASQASTNMSLLGAQLSIGFKY